MLDKLRSFKIELVTIFIGIIFGMLCFFIPFKYIVILFGAIVGIVLVFQKVEIGIFTVVFCLPFIPVMATVAIIILTIISFISKVITQNIKLKYSPMSFWIFIFVGLTLLFSITSVTPISSIKVALVQLVYIAFFFVTINTINNKNLLYLIMFAVVASGTLQSLYGIYQYKVSVPTIDENWTDTTLFPEMTTRVFGTLDNPNILAQYLELVIPITFSLFWIIKDYFKKTILIGLLGIMVLCLIFTSSRGGWVAFAIALVVFSLLKDRRIIMFGGLAGLFSIYFMPASIIDRISTVGSLVDTSNAYRAAIWKSSLNIIRDFWYSGVGLGSDAFSKIYNTYYIREGMTAFHTHNLYLQTLVETGIFGFLIFIIIIFMCYRRGLSAFVSSNDNFNKTIIAGMLGGMSGFLFHGISENSFYNFKILFMFWFIISMVMTVWEMEKAKSLTSNGDV